MAPGEVRLRMANEPVRAQLVLENGKVFSGWRFGASQDAAGEVVFNTSITGYQEILSDPSYAGQIVTMAYPLIGNYGINDEDFESRKLYLAGLIVKEPSRIPSNWRQTKSLDALLSEHRIGGLFGIDTRALVKHLRTFGAQRGVIVDATTPVDTAIRRAKSHPDMNGCDLAKTVTRGEIYSWDQSSPKIVGIHPSPAKFHVVAYDFGIKHTILRKLVDSGCRVTVVPAQTSSNDVLAIKPHGVLLSNGPGDPEPVHYAIANIKKLLGRVPIFGICLGHQLLCLAAGGKTYKLKFGHRGANHPVIDLSTKKVEITSHNHGFAVDADSLKKTDCEITHINLNDQTVEGLRMKSVPAFSVQYHPEAAAGPHDASYLFNRFTALMNEHRGAKD